jgi:hypothetical protein
MDFNIRKPVVLAAGSMALFSLLMSGPHAAQADAADTQASQPSTQPAGDKGDTTIIIKPPIIEKDPKK